MKIILMCLIASLLFVGILPIIHAENVPEWATDAISETEFVNAIEFLVKENIIQVNVSQTSETSQGVPEWVKNTAGWWATDANLSGANLNCVGHEICTIN